MAECNPNYVFYREAGGFLACDIRLTCEGPERSRKIAPHSLMRSPALKEMSSEHRRIAMQFITHCPENPIHTLLQGRNGFDLARTIIMSGRAYWLQESRKPIKWSPPCQGTLIWRPHGEKRFSTDLSIPDAPDFVVPLSPPLCIFTSTGLVRPVAASVPDDIIGEWSKPRPPMDHQAALEFCRVLGARHPDAVLPLPPAQMEPVKQNVAPIPCLLVAAKTRHGDNQGSESVTIPSVKLTFDYGLAVLLPSDTRKTIVATKDDKLIQCDRDTGTEAKVMERLYAIGFRPLEEIDPRVSDMAKKRDWFLSPEGPNDWAVIQSAIFPELLREGWRVEHDAGCQITPVDDDAWYSELETNPKGWFELGVGIRIGKKRVPLLPVIHQLLAQNRGSSLDEIRRHLAGRQIPVALEHQGFVLVAGDRLLVIIDNLVDLFDKPHEQGKPGGKPAEKVRLDLWRAAEIGQLEQWSSSPWNRPAALCSLTKRLAQANQLAAMPGPVTLRTTLRSYQQWGLAWLQFMRDAEFDGILADDMGLGKTIQTLAHLLIEKEAGRLDHPCLIICPTSVIQNWVDEAGRFAPSLRLLVSHGADRKEGHAKIADADLVLTSYALLRQDAEYLQCQTFSLVILDEAQYIKNHRAQTAQAACALKSTRRLCLTGTPMENHLGELWALFNFLMPGFLGSSEAFNSRFRRPIEKEGRECIRQTLSRRLAPFMLRRLKGQVEKELPAKTVMIHRVELTPIQRDLYESVRLAMQARIREEIASRGLGRSHITVLDGLLKLRQVCCDPRLVKHNAAARTGPSTDWTGSPQAALRAGGTENSAKLQALLDMVTEMLEEGRRILVFSQFVGILELIEAELTALRIPYSLLTGETQDRATPVRQFQNGQTKLFLISLKAGGTGLNLTAADTVIHYDPWWNPAAERQATDRAHRIGQTKPIFVYRFLTVGTVEARIQAMQERKQKLADSILQEQKADSVAFTLEDVESLFAPIGEKA
jgi:superfamily II DNA or RNA helicase